MILKTIGALLIMFSCSSVGFIEKYKHTFRIKELDNFIQCMDIFAVNICYSLEDIGSAISKVSAHATDLNREIFEKIAQEFSKSNGVPISEIWKNVLEKTNNGVYKKDDIEILKRFGDLLGNGNIGVQEENIQSLKKNLTMSVESLKNNEAKMSALSKIGIYAGIVIVVLMI